MSFEIEIEVGLFTTVKNDKECKRWQATRVSKTWNKPALPSVTVQAPG